MKSSLLKNILLSALWGAILSCAGADETVVSDGTTIDDWKPFQWNKTPLTIENSEDYPPEAKVSEGGKKGSIAAKMSWAGGEFKFASVQVKSPVALPAETGSISIWVKGSGTPHAVELHFKDAEGREKDDNDRYLKIIVGNLRSQDWQHFAKTIPSEWKQPLTFQGVTFTNWDCQDYAGDVTAYITRVTVE
jgi:hypothetical protein